MAHRDVTGAASSPVENASGDPVVVSELDSLTTLAASRIARVTTRNARQLFSIYTKHKCD
ncbi:MAG TPA: hypothetical protein VI750_11355 [Pyrinomonadaceae bacterium]|nr:hypothetical protein [Pyrinomonadaceae bacterium]